MSMDNLPKHNSPGAYLNGAKAVCNDVREHGTEARAEDRNADKPFGLLAPAILRGWDGDRPENREAQAGSHHGHNSRLKGSKSSLQAGSEADRMGRVAIEAGPSSYAALLGEMFPRFCKLALSTRRD